MYYNVFITINLQNIRNNVMSGIQDTADFAVNIHPPHEDLEETLKSLDGIMMLENAQRRADNEEFYEAEQRLLKIHKNKIRDYYLVYIMSAKIVRHSWRLFMFVTCDISTATV
ncbi:hypothetical protein MACJ_003951 [Theileria orientalis]|uniref:Uncharacterized protein n=1 Tax=Theileria orientalis TaxID=68886 RepID=A0A976XIL6_THEOR|nr:hypothetical protein MACJ_003951 [Theileria orientalis]